MGLSLKTFCFYFFCRVRPPFRSARTSLHSTLDELCRRNKKKVLSANPIFLNCFFLAKKNYLSSLKKHDHLRVRTTLGDLFRH